VGTVNTSYEPMVRVLRINREGAVYRFTLVVKIISGRLYCMILPRGFTLVIKLADQGTAFFLKACLSRFHYVDLYKSQSF